jgi:hypothetical protein
MAILELLFTLVLCHLVGDYVLQIDFIAKSKGNNVYHLLVHCLLYCLPFYIAFGFVWQLIPILLLHIVIDLLKAKFKLIPYWLDQVLHYVTCLLYLI